MAFPNGETGSSYKKTVSVNAGDTPDLNISTGIHGSIPSSSGGSGGNVNPLIQNYTNYLQNISGAYNNATPTGVNTTATVGTSSGANTSTGLSNLGGIHSGAQQNSATNTNTQNSGGISGNVTGTVKINVPNTAQDYGNLGGIHYLPNQNAVDDNSDTTSQTTQTDNSGSGGGSGGSSGGYSGGGYGYSGVDASTLAALAQLTGTATGTDTGTTTSSGYTSVTGSADTNSAQNALAYLQLLQAAGYDLSQPLTDIQLPNAVDLPEEVALPENFDFQNAYNNAPDVDIGRIDRIDTHPEEEMLGQITDLQQQQAILSADNTVKNGVTELQRVMQDAQDQYLAQQNQINIDEQKALDNQVLYNEARGDRGGIGQAQYNTIQNTAATNRMTVQKEQTQLATDTARQIADLRSQGEFEKANQLLSISQKYLSELMDLYQWAKETNVSIDEFNLQVAQWEENFKLSLVGAELDAEAFNLNVANAMIDQQNNLFNARLNQENSLFDARLSAAQLQNDEAAARLNAQLNAANATGAFGNGTPTYAAQQDAIANQLSEREMLADIGLALIEEGIQPSSEILAAMGMGGTSTTSTSTTGTLSSVLSQMGYSDATSALRAMGIGSAGLAGIAAMGYTPEQYLAEALGVSTTNLPTLDTSTWGSSTTTTDTTNSSNSGQEIVNQLSEVAAYTTPTTTQSSTQGYTDADVYAAFGADPETVLRAAGIGSSGLAGLAALGISPAQFVGQAFGL